MFTQIKPVFRYRHLIWEFAINDIKVRYRTPILGFLWSILIPLAISLVFKFIFSNLMKASIENYPFFIYLITAIFPWTYFSSSVNQATGSILNNRELIKKTYFPRQIIPISAVMANLINFLPAILVMLMIAAMFKIEFSWYILLLPVVVFLHTIFTIGLALIFSSLQVILRDTKYIVELLLICWLYLSPTFYSLKLIANISDKLLGLYFFNPFTGLFTFYRMTFLKGYLATLPAGINIFNLSIWTIAVCLGVFFLGFLVFSKYESRFFDLV